MCQAMLLVVLVNKRAATSSTGVSVGVMGNSQAHSPPDFVGDVKLTQYDKEGIKGVNCYGKMCM